MDTLVNSPTLTVKYAVVGVWKTNVYRIFDHQSSTMAVIDAPRPADKVLRDTGNYKPIMLLITHGHWDHIDGAAEVAQRWNLPVGVSKHDMPSGWDCQKLDVGDGNSINIGSVTLNCLHTPGHTVGSTCYYLESASLRNGLLFSGDTLFPGGPGRTATPAMFKQILHSIKSKLLKLEDDCQVLPGHGPPTTIGEARAGYAAFEKAGIPNDLAGDVLWKN